MAKNDIKATLKKVVMDIVYANKDEVINEIVKQKTVMFDDNSHGWSSLLPQTIKRKKRDKALFRSPESINIRKGGLFKAFTAGSSYSSEKYTNFIDFNIDLGDKNKTKANTVAGHGRSVTDVTPTELSQIATNLAGVIADGLRQKYGS